MIINLKAYYNVDSFKSCILCNLGKSYIGGCVEYIDYADDLILFPCCNLIFSIKHNLLDNFWIGYKPSTDEFEDQPLWLTLQENGKSIGIFSSSNALNINRIAIFPIENDRINLQELKEKLEKFRLLI